ncbi:MAG TPA: protein-glutamate O-methyltransferase [Desulfurivibrionaceae bacterium]|nr:protein-glutamate O-methyltransferase [Desulfurivibrionaceae bacterium]
MTVVTRKRAGQSEEESAGGLGPSESLGLTYRQLTDLQFQKFSALVYEKAGIYLKPEKKELLNARLGKRLRALGLDSFKEYYEYVMRDASGDELVQMIDVVSTNFTSFFRESSHFDLLQHRVLPEIVTAANRRKEISLWSSACSSGEEPYTMAMVVASFLETHPGWKFRLMATDISTKVLAQAQRGVYPDERIAKVPPIYLKRYFQKGVGNSAGYVKVKEALQRHITFSRFNLMHEFPWREELDVIFCRNVMIYFNRETQQELVAKFYRALVPGGYLFIGHSESITSLKHDFTQVDATAYQKR